MDTTILEELVRWLQAADFLGPGLFVVVFVLATLFFLPASPLTMAAGFLYGPLTGTAATSFAGLISAVLAFLISRYLAGERMQAWSASFPRARTINIAVSSDGFRVVFLLRLASILPFIPLSYLLGMSCISTSRYVLATWLGLLPGTFLYVLSAH
ncbi:MAG: TVP38/TMEM64 family protein [Morganella morganii]